MGGSTQNSPKKSSKCHKLEFSIFIRHWGIHYFRKDLEVYSNVLIGIVNKEISRIGNKLDIYKTSNEIMDYWPAANGFPMKTDDRVNYWKWSITKIDYRVNLSHWLKLTVYRPLSPYGAARNNALYPLVCFHEKRIFAER